MRDTGNGNPRLRAALVELAWRMVRFEPHYRAVPKWKERLKKRPAYHPRGAQKAIVALARQLAIDLWRWRTCRATAAELGWRVASVPLSDGK